MADLSYACWSCKAVIDGAQGAITCPHCGKVIPPHPHASPFARLAIDPPRFDLSRDDVERAWMQRARKVHPDRFMQKKDAAGDSERRYAAEQTAALNEAQRILRDPFDRAVWMVKSAGVDVAGQDQAFLVQMMEAREQAEQSAADKAQVIAASTTQFAAAMASVATSLAQPAPPYRAVAKRLAEAKTLARLVADLGGAPLISSMGSSAQDSR